MIIANTIEAHIKTEPEDDISEPGEATIVGTCVKLYLHQDQDGKRKLSWWEAGKSMHARPTQSFDLDDVTYLAIH